MFLTRQTLKGDRTVNSLMSVHRDMWSFKSDNGIFKLVSAV